MLCCLRDGLIHHFHERSPDLTMSAILERRDDSQAAVDTTIHDNLERGEPTLFVLRPISTRRPAWQPLGISG